MLNSSFIKYILMFVLLIFFQVVLFNSMSFLRFAIPLAYIYFIIKLPIGINKNLCLILGFFMGFVIDIFSNTPGINAASVTLIALLRQPIQSVFFNIDEHLEESPSIGSLGIFVFVKYISFITLIHSISIVILESFSFFNIKLIILRILCSSILTILIMLGLEGFSRNHKQEKSWH